MEDTSSALQHVSEFMTDSFMQQMTEPGYFPDISQLAAMTNENETSAIYQDPYLEILEQPKQRGFRFRYHCEGAGHGGLPGEFSKKGKKTYPSVHLCNYYGPARIVVSLVTADDPPIPHAHSLFSRSIKNGIHTVQIGPEQGMTASFPNLGIEHVTKKNVVKVLMDRHIREQAPQTATVNAMANDAQGTSSIKIDQHLLNVLGSSDKEFDKNSATALAEEEARKIRILAEKRAKEMNLSAVRLCFQALLPDENGYFTKRLAPVISNKVYDSKAPSSGALKIRDMDKNSGCVTGGEKIYLLCDKVQKDDIEVHFFQHGSDGKVIWEDLAIFEPSDVHRQFAIVFKTPAYLNIFTEQPAHVMLELRRKTDGETSDPKEFTYHPQNFDKEQIRAKRRKTIPHYLADNFPSGGVASQPLYNQSTASF